MQSYIKNHISNTTPSSNPASNNEPTASTAPSAPKHKRPAKIANLAKRGKVWYFTMSKDGRRFSQSLGTADKAVAVRRARGLAAAAKGERWKVLDGAKKDLAPAKCAALGEVFAALRQGAIGLGLKEHTVYGYCQQLSNVVRRVHAPGHSGPGGTPVDGVDGLSTALLTEELVLRFQDIVLNATPLEQRDRAQRTIRSTVTNARAVFSKRTDRLYRHLQLPDLNGFKAATLNRALTKSYRLPPGDLIERTLRAGSALRASRPDLYAVFMLTYDLALRAGEAAACQWSWFAHRDGQWEVEILRRPGFSPKWNKERRVPLSAETWLDLQELRGAKVTDDFVLPTGDREDLVKREFAAWMRSMGWDRNEYPKAAHELRKLMGSRWYTELGAEVAQEWLGHESVATTCSFYTALRRQPRALTRENAKA